MKTIYFTAGPVPTPQEITDAAAISGKVVLRNAEYVGTTDAIELCDAVAGAVPQIYIDYFKKSDGYFVEAPEDGQTYGRKDAAWDEVTSGGGGGGLSPLYPAQHYGSILIALNPALGEGDCGWSPTMENVETNIYNGRDANTQVDGSNFVICGSDSGEYGTRTFKVILYVHSNTNFSLTSKLRVQNPTTEDTFDSYGYLSLYESEITRDDGTVIKRGFKHNNHQKSYLYDYMDTVLDPNSFDNIYNESVVTTAALITGTYLLKLNLDFNNDVALYMNETFFFSADGGSVTMTIVSETGQAHRALLRF